MSFDRLLKDTAVVLRLTGTLDEYGNVENAYAPVGSPIKVRLDVDSVTEDSSDRETTQQTGVVFARPTDIQASDLLSINTVAWEVRGVPIERFSPGSMHHLEVHVRRTSL